MITEAGLLYCRITCRGDAHIRRCTIRAPAITCSMTLLRPVMAARAAAAGAGLRTARAPSWNNPAVSTLPIMDEKTEVAVERQRQASAAANIFGEQTGEDPPDSALPSISPRVRPVRRGCLLLGWPSARQDFVDNLGDASGDTIRIRPGHRDGGSRNGALALSYSLGKWGGAMSTRIDEAHAALCRFDGAAALSAFDEVLGDNANDNRALAGRVSALWMLRRWDEACTRLAELDDRNDSVQVALARGLVALGQPDDPSYLSVDCGSAKRADETAIAAFEDAARLDELSVEAVAGLATAYRMSGRLQQAEELLQNARPRLRSSAPALMESAMCKLERDDLPGAEADALLAVKDEPGCLQAELLRLELRRRTNYGDEESVAQTEKLVRRQPGPTAVVLELYGWVLLDRADATGDRGLRGKAMEQFVRSEEVGPALPGAVNGKIQVHLGNGRLKKALEVADAAIARDPFSPQLHLSRAEIIALAGEPPQALLDSYQAVLTQDPRDLNARIAKVRGLISLQRIDEAEEIVRMLHDELPGNPHVYAAARWLEEPWQMFESRTIEQRLDRPWDSGNDDPEQVLDLLTNEVCMKLALSQSAASRLRERVVEDRRALLQRAFEEEQAYLHAQARFRAWAQRARKRCGLALSRTRAVRIWIRVRSSRARCGHLAGHGPGRPARGLVASSSSWPHGRVSHDRRLEPVGQTHHRSRSRGPRWRLGADRVDLAGRPAVWRRSGQLDRHRRGGHHHRHGSRWQSAAQPVRETEREHSAAGVRSVAGEPLQQRVAALGDRFERQRQALLPHQTVNPERGVFGRLGGDRHARLRRVAAAAPATQQREFRAGRPPWVGKVDAARPVVRRAAPTGRRTGTTGASRPHHQGGCSGRPPVDGVPDPLVRQAV